jgi:hypothetical protein
MAGKLLLAFARTVIPGSESHGAHELILLSDKTSHSQSTIQSKNQSQSYFTTGSLSPITSSWC